ncbi:NAD(P)-dependent dehydrogenase (short-subunit alcohol dehydrogenase family) [Kutzneria buriramensis]|uniref:NAD(P)-dependent dehydrogenase (Short-subunit alcohol dehydrogenase family) n=1 Tax=Kutzneria buriramensis TaxID=1045776 RepID=A0A3E0GUV5_9PSEU|nr:NAD(P)-dependent dehydrogenase (short-subunit alcohol dehydrogenase family) [Kutzneria buriramensis]
MIGRGGGIAGAVAAAARAAGHEVVVAGRNAGEHVDLTDESSVEALAARLGTVDHVVSTASARARGTVDSLSHEAVLASFNVKVVGAMLLAKHFAPRMPATGSFVFFSGASARKPVVGMLAVGGTNAALDAVVRGLAVELAPIRVNAVSPGTIDSGAYDALGERAKADLFAARRAGSPARRVGAVEDVADAVLFALGSTFMTGVSLAIDGGEVLV